MQFQVLPVAVDGRALQPCRFARLDPLAPRFGHGRGFVGRDMYPLADIDRHLRLAGVGVLLALERLDVPRAVDRVVEYPGFPLLTLPRRPGALAYRHLIPLSFENR